MQPTKQQQPHRTGPLHQTNKKHKVGKHEGKATATKEVRTKMVVPKFSLNQRKQDRLNQANQIRKSKRDRVIEEKRKLGKDSQPPLLVGILELETKIDGQSSLLDLLKQCDETMTVQKVSNRLFRVISSRFRMRYDFLMLDEDNFDESLDLSKTLDILCVSHPITLDEIPESQLLKTIYVHCLPKVINVVTGISDALNMKKALEIKKKVKANMDDDDKLYQVDKPADALQLLHAFSSCKRRKSLFKETRSALLVERSTIEEDKLKLFGYVRNGTLSPDDLLHVVGWDDYQIEKIEILADPMPMRSTKDSEMSLATALVPDPMKQENLDQENELDPMEGEQTWPTAEELAAEAEKRNIKRVIKKLPPGTSAYQGAWIPEEEEILSDTDSNESGDSDVEIDDAESPLKELDSDNDAMSDAQSEHETIQTETNAVMDVEEYDKNHTVEKERNILEKIKEARMEEMFPDEVDTPLEMPARVRFARYRGLKSFRNTEWDPQENLPPDYSRIYQFQNFQQTRRRVLNEVDDNGAQPGKYVCVHLKEVPKPMIAYFEINQQQPVLAVGLLKYERKMSVMNFVIKKVPNCPLKEPIKSKDELIFYTGFRKFKSRPLFTNHGLANKFKYERFFRDDAAMVATTYAPITFPPAPVLVFKLMDTGEKILVASGSVLDSNPNRLIIKRIRLSGHPFKIYSKNAVIRFMFFNAEDILYFKPTELVTKYNRRGHITEPIGTHGHMKCVFDKKIKSDDCIFMNLYKRVYPKWTYQPINNLTGNV